MTEDNTDEEKINSSENTNTYPDQKDPFHTWKVKDPSSNTNPSLNTSYDDSRYTKQPNQEQYSNEKDPGQVTNVFKRKHPCKYNRGVEEKRKVGYKESQGAANPILVSRDIMDGNVPNYKQTEEGTLYKSIHGFPLCNYCNMPNHK